MGDTLIEKTNECLIFEAKKMLLGSFQKLFEFLQKEILCDIVIKVGQKSIKCHKAILASCSPYFQAMFTSPLSERDQSVITIGDIDEIIMEQLVKFAYTARVELNSSNALSFLHAASVLQLEDLVQVCCEFIKLHLHFTNCLGIRQFAECHGLTSLVVYIDNFTRHNFQDVLSTEEFLSIGVNQLQDLISSSNLCVESEMEVYEAVIRWIKHDKSKREYLLPDLLLYIHLPLVPIHYLRLYVETDEMIRTSLKCRDLLGEAKDYQLWQAGILPTVHLCFTTRNKPRKSYAGMLFCVGGRAHDREPFASIECYSWFHNKWLKLADMSTKRRHVGCVSVNGKIYAVGGYDGKEHLSSTEVFDPFANKWNLLSCMTTPRRGLGLCSLGGAIYAVGGLDDKTYFTTVERYDISSDIWSTVASMNISRGGVAVTEFRGLMYALGGIDGPLSVSTCEVYDPHLNKWTFIASMSETRSGAGAAVVDGFIYVVGGFDNNTSMNTVEKYDPDSNTWVTISPMNCRRGGVSVATMGGKIYAVGGHNGQSYLNTVEVYDAENDRWEFSPSIIESRAGAGVTCCPCTYKQLCKVFNTLSTSSDT